MKKWTLWIYLVAIHLLLFAAIGYIGWHKKTIASLPMRIEWHWGSTYKDAPMAMAFPNIEDSDYAIAKIDGETFAVFGFKKSQLDMISLGWPGDLKEYSISESSTTISTDRSILGRGEDGYRSDFWDVDGDGIFESERQDEASERALRRAEWKTVWREDRLPDGSAGPREYFDPAGRLVFRVTEIFPPAPQNSTSSQPFAALQSPSLTYLVEEFENGDVVSRETLSHDELKQRNLISEAGHPPRAEWSRQRTPAP